MSRISTIWVKIDGMISRVNLQRHAEKDVSTISRFGTVAKRVKFRQFNVENLGQGHRRFVSSSLTISRATRNGASISNINIGYNRLAQFQKHIDLY